MHKKNNKAKFLDLIESNDTQSDTNYRVAVKALHETFFKVINAY